MQHKSIREALSKDGEGDIRRGKHSGQYVDHEDEDVDQRTTTLYFRKINSVHCRLELARIAHQDMI